MEKYLLTFFLASLILAPGASALDFAPMELSHMVRSADLAVMGSVNAASTSTFTLRVEEAIFGPDTGAEVKFLRNRDWSGTEGPGIFRIGQRMVVFAGRLLDSSGGVKPMWRTTGIENESVLPIDDNEIYFSGTVTGVETETYDLDGITMSAYAFDLSDFFKAVRAYKNCFGFIGVDSSSVSKKGPCTDGELEAFRNEIDLGRFLVDPSSQREDDKINGRISRAYPRQN